MWSAKGFIFSRQQCTVYRNQLLHSNVCELQFVPRFDRHKCYSVIFQTKMSKTWWLQLLKSAYFPFLFFFFYLSYIDIISICLRFGLLFVTIVKCHVTHYNPCYQPTEMFIVVFFLNPLTQHMTILIQVMCVFNTAKPLSSLLSLCVTEMSPVMKPNPLSALSFTFLNHIRPCIPCSVEQNNKA